MKTLTQIASGFEKLLARLPGAIRKPVEREWRPLQELFLHKRPARLLVLGEPGVAADAWVQSVFQMDQGKTEPSTPSWTKYQHRGLLEFAVAGNEETAREAILSTEPDLLVLVAGDNEPDFPRLNRLHVFAYERYSKLLPIVAVSPKSFPLKEALNGQNTLRLSVVAVLEPTRREETLASIYQTLPLESRLEFARVSGEPSAQIEIAAMLTRSTTAVCTAIGAQPIPLADLPILTSLQVAMVAGIIHATGREWSMRLARDFFAALGVNIGMGFLLREGARAVVKLLPGWGNAISGAVAGAGTYAIGRAATAFFIEGLSLDEARSRFKILKNKKRPLK